MTTLCFHTNRALIIRLLKPIAEKSPVITAPFPDEWDEITQRQLLLIADHLWNPKTKIASARDLLAAMIGLPKKQFRKISPHQLSNDLMPLLGFIAEENLLSKWLIPRLGRYYGPAEKLSNITVDEFIGADMAYTHYFELRQNDPKQAHKQLCRLAAILYRPKKWWWSITRLFPSLNSGDCRQPLNDNTIDMRARKFEKLPLPVLLAIMHNYQGCRNWIHATFPDAWQTSDEQKTGTNKYGIVAFAVDMAGGKFGNVTETGNTLLFTVLIELEQTAARNKIKDRTDDGSTSYIALGSS